LFLDCSSLVRTHYPAAPVGGFFSACRQAGAAAVVLCFSRPPPLLISSHAVLVYRLRSDISFFPNQFVPINYGLFLFLSPRRRQENAALPFHLFRQLRSFAVPLFRRKPVWRKYSCGLPVVLE